MRYENASEALDKLRRNGLAVKLEGETVLVSGQPGLKLLGAIDYLKSKAGPGYNVRLVQTGKFPKP